MSHSMPKKNRHTYYTKFIHDVQVLQTRSSGIRQVLPAAEQNVDVENYKVLMIIFMC